MRGARCGVRWPHGPGGRACLAESGEAWARVRGCGREASAVTVASPHGCFGAMTWPRASPKMRGTQQQKSPASRRAGLPRTRAPVHWREGGPHEGQAGGPRGRLKGASAGSRSGAACGGHGNPFCTPSLPQPREQRRGIHIGAGTGRPPRPPRCREHQPRGGTPCPCVTGSARAHPAGPATPQAVRRQVGGPSGAPWERFPGPIKAFYSKREPWPPSPCS